MKNPSYEDVCTGQTGHAEAVQIEFNPKIISYEKLLEIFFKCHDPTTKDRQGPDMGNQYRSVIFTHGAEQNRIAVEIVAELEEAAIYSGPVVTEILPAPVIYPAEDYHQDYFRNNPNQPYCSAVIRPKVEKFEHKLQGTNR